jgi:K+:H+ antiporter
LASACAIALFTRVGLPAPVGYLLAGLVIGPHGLQLLAVSDETRFLAELGVILLMFMVALEFSLQTLIAARTDVFGAGSLQVGLTSLIVAAAPCSRAWTGKPPSSWAEPWRCHRPRSPSSQLADQGEIGRRSTRLRSPSVPGSCHASVPRRRWRVAAKR